MGQFDMRIRPAVGADADAAAVVLQRSIAELCERDHFNNPDAIAAWIANKTPDHVREWLTQADKAMYVAETERGVIGVGLVSNEGFIYLLYVSPGGVGTGAGRALLEAMETHVRAYGVTRMKLESSQTARSFYERFGYVATATLPSKRGLAPSTEMERRLVAAEPATKPPLKPDFTHRLAAEDDLPAIRAQNAQGHPKTRASENIYPSGTIILVRHCLSTGQAPDAPLAPKGHESALLLADRLADMGVSALFSSPYVRARQTLEPLSQRSGLAITLDARLRERTLSNVDLPDWRDHIARSFADRDYRAPGGESFNDVATRALAALSDVIAAGHALPAIATHGNLLSALLNMVDLLFGFADWQAMGNPDLFEAKLEQGRLSRLQRLSF